MKRWLMTLIVATVVTAGAAAAVPERSKWPCPPGPSYTGTSDRLVQTSVGDPVDVLFPRSYDAGTRRYPVAYVLHGGGQTAHDWPELSDIIEFTEDKEVIVVFPGSDRVGWWSDWRDGSLTIETDLIESIIPEIDARYRTIPDRMHRGLFGESMGGFGTMHIASHHPDTFGFAGSVSGAIFEHETSAPLMTALHVVVNAICGDTRDPNGMYGSFVSDEVWWRDNNPVDLAENLRGVSLYVGHGNGVPCDAERDISSTFARTYPIGELFGMPAGRQFPDALDRAGVPFTYDPLPCGTHDWPYFNEQMHHLWPQMESVFAQPHVAAPASFDHKRAAPRFSVWGWTFSADPRRAAEFLEVEDASAVGVTLVGSGLETVTTGGYFRPGQQVTLRGAAEPSAIADAAGRITFHVDLGPPHTDQQYSPAARLLEALGGYWASRVVAFAAEE